MTIYKNFLVVNYVFLIFVLYACTGVYDEKITGRYYIVSVDYANKDMSLNFQLDDGSSYGIVGKTVFAVGYNAKYIIVKQHPLNNKIVTNYYILPNYTENTYWAAKGLLGPLTLLEFDKKRKELDIPNSLIFTKEIKD